MSAADTPYKIGDFAYIKMSRWVTNFGQVVEVNRYWVKFALLNVAGVRSTHAFRTLRRSFFPYHVKKLDRRPTRIEMRESFPIRFSDVELFPR